MRTSILSWIFTFGFLLGASGALRAADATTVRLPSRGEIVRNAVADGEKVWRAANRTPPTVGSRDLFGYALVLCEAKTNLNRLDKLFELAAQMQDRDPQSRTYGNFRWNWSHEGVLDGNAVDFCMQMGALLWLRHQPTMPADVREKLRDILEFAAQGLLGHHVPEHYTNIALMNAGDLILLGEALGKPEVADEGYARLDRFLLVMWEGGTHEYCSPTYYGVDLDDLGLIEAFCQRERGRQQARALLEFFWTDIALNWFPPAQKLAGARSRDYDYLRGLGFLDQQMMANGWLPTDEKNRVSFIVNVFTQWRPPARLKKLSETRLPRLVQQIWGYEPEQSRTHYLCRDVTLSASGAGYGGWMDLPLCVDLPGDRTGVRCYFIPDGRHDPYGKIKIQAGKAHQKTLHLQPFWTAAQRRVDALGLTVYRDQDVPDTTETLESHFVMPLDVDGFWIGERRIEFSKGRAAEFPLKPGEALVLRKGTAAVGVRLPWTRGWEGDAAPVSLVHDTNPFGAVRLTVAHHHGVTKTNAGAAFWVRIGSGISSDEDFARWRRQFAVARAETEVTAGSINIRVSGEDGPLQVQARPPFAVPAHLEPPPVRTLLAVDGEDVGRRLLENIEPIKSYRVLQTEVRPIDVEPGTSVYWEAEAGRVRPGMFVERDAAASNGAFVWKPGKPGQAGGGAQGSVTWRLNVARAGRYFLWGRVLAPTPSDDSFFVRLMAGNKDLVEPTMWATGVHKRWEWTPVSLDGTRAPTPFALPLGQVNLHLGVREDGTRIDRLFLTSSPEEKPRQQ